MKDRKVYAFSDLVLLHEQGNRSQAKQGVKRKLGSGQEQPTCGASNDFLTSLRKEVQGRQGDPVVDSQVLHVTCWIETDDEEEFRARVQKAGMVALIEPLCRVLERDRLPLPEPLVLRHLCRRWRKLGGRSNLFPRCFQLIDRTFLHSYR